MILNAASVKANGAIAVQDAGGLAVFYDQVAVVLLLVGKVAVAVEKHFAKFGPAQDLVFNNPTLGGQYDPDYSEQCGNSDKPSVKQPPGRIFIAGRAWFFIEIVHNWQND